MNQKEIKALISLLDDDDHFVFEHVGQKIISMGEAVIPFLEDEWENNFNPEVQKRIEELIHTLQFDLLRDRLETWSKEGGKDLLEGMWLVATYQYPDLEFDKLKADLEQVYYDVWTEFKKDLQPLEQTSIINNVLFNRHRFSANTKNFHSPGNSMLNVVLESRRGNPISLCVIYMIIARRLKMPVSGVNLPNLFVLIYETPEGQDDFYINAFNKGLIFSKEDLTNYIEHLKIEPIDMFYEPCNNKNIIKRVLRNLIVCFEKLGDMDKVQELTLLLEVMPDVD